VVRHVLLLHDPAAAERLAAEARAAAYDVAIDTHDGGWTWIVGVTEPGERPADEPRLVALAAAYGAEYEGWESA
jgi:hypothetical protein